MIISKIHTDLFLIIYVDLYKSYMIPTSHYSSDLNLC
jgi:hypothetical protein